MSAAVETIHDVVVVGGGAGGEVRLAVSRLMFGLILRGCDAFQSFERRCAARQGEVR